MSWLDRLIGRANKASKNRGGGSNTRKPKPKPKQNKPKSSGGSKPNKPTRPTGTANHRGGTSAPVNRRRSDSSSQPNRKKRIQQREQKRQTVQDAYKQKQQKSGTAQHRFKATVKKWDTSPQQQRQAGAQAVRASASKLGAAMRTATSTAVGKAYEKDENGHLTSKTNALGTKATTQSVKYGSEHKTTLQSGFKYSSRHGKKNKTTVISSKPSEAEIQAHETEEARRKALVESINYHRNRRKEYEKKFDETTRRWIAANYSEKDRKAVYDYYMNHGGKKDRAKYGKDVADAMTKEYSKAVAKGTYGKGGEVDRIKKEHSAGTLRSKDLNAEDYLKLQNASRMGNPKLGNKALGKDLAEKVGSRTALSADKNVAARISTGAMQGLAYGDVLHGSVGTYNKDARGALKEAKESNAYMGGYMGGFMGGFALSGAGSAGRVAGRGTEVAANTISNIVRKAAGREGRQLAEVGTESAKKAFIRNRLGELIAESPVNVADALKMSKDENGKVNKAEFLSYLGLNTVMTGAMGGAMEGAGMALAKKNAKRMTELLGKRQAGALSEAETAELDTLARKISDLHEYSASSRMKGVQPLKEATDAKAIENNMVATAERDGIIRGALKDSEAKEYIKLNATKKVKGAKALNEAETARLKELQDKVTTERVKVEKELDASVKTATENLQTKSTASMADVAKTISASVYYRNVGDAAKAKEAEAVVKRATKSIQNDLDEIGKASGVKYVASTSDEINAKLLEAGKVGRFGELDNGVLITGKNGKKEVYVNLQSEDAYRVIIGHETTHLLSKTNNFGALKNAVRELGTKMGDYDRLYSEYADLYADEVKGMTEKEAKDYIEEEVTAQLVGKYIFGDSSSDFIKTLAKDENVFRQVYDYIVNALKKAIGDGGAPKTEEAKMLQTAKDEFEKAYKEMGGNPEALKDKARLSMAGKNAKGVDKDAGTFAEALHKLGLNNESIHRITGWRVDTDGKAKFEFSDKGMKLKFTMKELRGGTKAEIEKAEAAMDNARGAMYNAIRNGTEKEAKIAESKFERASEQYRKVSGTRFKSGTTLGQILDHKELFKYYPDAKNIQVQFRSQAEMGRLAAAYQVTGDGTEEILLKENAKKADLESSLLHEIQHAIQEREGFASGTTPDEWSRINSRLIQRVVETLDELPREEARALVSAGDSTTVMRRKAVDVIRRTLGEDRAREYEKWLDALDLLADEYKTLDNAYWHTKGEWEARQTQARRKMSQEELDGTPREVDEKELRVEDYKGMDRSAALARDSKQTEASLEWQADNVDTPYLKSVGPEPRYSKVKETDVDPVTGRNVLELLDEQEANGDYVTVYRSLAKVNGRYYPPMSSKMNDRFVEPIRMGEWDGAVEDTSRLITNKNGELDLSEEGYGYTDLKKANGKSTSHVAYNPYNHTSPSMLNDQFTEAFKRPELVVVECHVPKSELTSKYKAPYAKDSVGYIDWHSGPVTAKLPGTRNVLLSRWVKPVREVPADEIAQSIKAMFDDAGVELEMPYNRVTPQVRQGLEKLGVKIAESDSSAYPKEPPAILKPLKERQFDIIQETNPADEALPNHTWVRSVDDIKSFGEAVDDPEFRGETEFAPDYTMADAEEALSTGKIRVYSSQTIENGAFVTPSEMIARDYNGGKKPKSKIVDLHDVAWIDPTEGQLAKQPKGEVKFSKSKRQKKKAAKRAAEYSEEKANPEILESAKTDRASAEERLASLTAERDKLARRQKNISKYGKQEGKAEKLKTIRENLAGLDEQIATANKEIKKAQKTIDDFERNESAKPKTRKEQTTEELTAEIEGFKEDIKPIKAEIREKRAELAKLDEVDYSKMPKKEMEAHLAERNALSREINSLQKRIGDLNGEIASREKIISKNADNRIKAQKVEPEAQAEAKPEVKAEPTQVRQPATEPVKAPKETPKEQPDTSFKETEDFDKYMQSRFKSARLKDFTNRAIDYGVDVSERVKEFNSLDKEIAALTAKRKNSHTPAHIKEYTEGIEKAEARQTEIAASVYKDFREAQHKAYADEKVARKEWTPETVSTETESIRTAADSIGGVKNFADEVKSVVPKKGSDGTRAQKVVAEEIKDPDSCLNNYLDGDASKDRGLQDARASALLENISERLKADPDDTKAMSDLMKVVDKMGEDSTLPSNVRNSAKALAVATPKGRVGVALRAVDDLNKRYGDRIDGVLKLTDDELEKLATTEPGKELDDLYESITGRLWENIPATRIEKFNEVRHMFMLANIRTHARNTLGNVMLRGVRRIADDIEIGLQSKVFREAIEKRGGEVDRVKVRGQEIRDNGKYLEAEWEAAYKNSDSVSRWIETNRPDGVPVVKMKSLNWMIQADYKALEAEDMWTFKPAFKKSYVQYVKAKDAAAKKIIDAGGTAERWDIKNLTEAQKKMARDRALFDAEYATFRDRCLMSEWLTGKKHLLATKEGKTILGTGMYRLGNAAMEGVLPFVKTPINIFRRSVDFSPASLGRCVFELASKDPETFKQGIRHLATGLTGTGIWAFGFYLADSEVISIDTKLGEHSGSKYYDQDMGYQDYSVVINAGGVHQSWTIDWLQPMQASLFMGAAFRQFWDEAREGDVDVGTSAIAGVFAATSPMFDASFMSGAKDMMETLMMRASKETEEGESNLPAAIVQMLAGDIPKNYLSSVVPQAVSQVANLTDNVQRDTRSTLKDPILASWDSAAKQIVNRIPVLRKYYLNPKLDRWGDDKTTGGNIATRMFNTLMNPSTVKEITENKYDRALIGIRNSLEKGSWLYKNFFYNFTGNPDYELANGKRMTYDQLYDYGKASRKEQTLGVHHMVDAPSYNEMPNEMKADEVNAIFDIGKMAGDYSFGVNYAIKKMKGSTDSVDTRDAKIYDQYKEAAKGSVDKNKFWQWRMDKERAMARAHNDTEDGYRIKGLYAIATGDDALVEAVHLKGQKEPELRKYWNAVKKDAKKSGQRPRILAYNELTDACCRIMSNVKKAGLDDANLGTKSVAAGKVAKDGKQISERVYRAYGHFWNSAQAGGGLQLKYNDKNDKYSVKNIDKYERELDKRLEKKPDGVSGKDVVMDFIENDLKVTNKDEAACLYQILYIKGYGNQANKAHWKNPYKEVIDDHLKWGKNQDEVYSGSRKGGWGHRRRGGWGHGGWGHGGGGSGGSASGVGAMLPDAPKAVKATKNFGELPKANFSQAKASKAKVTDTYAKASDYTKPSTVNDAYRKRARKLSASMRKKLS